MAIRFQTLINSFAGGTNNTTISSGNSGGVSGAPLDLTSVGSGAALKYDNTRSAHLSGFSAKISTGASPAVSYMGWQGSMPGSNQSQVWFREFLYFSSMPQITTSIFTAKHNTSTAAQWVINGFEGTISAYGTGANPGNAAKVGVTTNGNQYAGANDSYQSALVFDGIMGQPWGVQSQKVYYTQNGVQYPTSVATDVQELMRAGCTVWLCYQPTFDASGNGTPADKRALSASIQAHLAIANPAGVSVKIVLWQEPQNGQNNMSAAQCQNMFAYYASTVRALGVPLVYDSATHLGPSGVTSYYPGDANCDEIAVDYYGNVFVNTDNQTGASLLAAQTLADNAVPPKPLGVGEMGSTLGPSITNQQVINYITFIQNTMSARLTAGKQNSNVMWFNGLTNNFNTINSGDFRIPYLKGLFNAIDPSSIQGVTTSSRIPLGQWFRVEGTVVGASSGGQVGVSLYTSEDSTLVTETQIDTSLSTSGATTSWLFGQGQSTANIGPYWMDDIGLSNSGAIGPVLLGFQSIRADNGGATTMVAQNPTNPANLVVGGDVEGFFTTQNYGTNWQTSNSGVWSTQWRKCATIQWSIFEPNTLYACVGDIGSGGGFLVSVDGGLTWSMRNSTIQFAGNSSGGKLSPSDKSRSTGNVLAQTGTGGLMYCATFRQGVYRTKGQVHPGTNWTNIGLSSLPGGGTAYGRCIFVDPANQDNLYVGMYNSGIWKATNASSASSANFSLLTNSPAFPEQLLILSNGNIYVACGSQGLQRSTNGGSTWTSLDSAGTFLSKSAYWMSLDGYVDSNGNDQLIVGSNNSVKGPTGTGLRTLMWASYNNTTNNIQFTDLTTNLANIQVAVIPPETDRTWWHVPTGEQLGKQGMIQARPLIDKNTISGAQNQVSIYCAGASGFYKSADGGQTWTIAINGMPLHVGHSTDVDPSNPLHIRWTTSDFCEFDLSDGVGYNASTTYQGIPPVAPVPGGGRPGMGYTGAIDPVDSTCYLSTGEKYVNNDGQIWMRPGPPALPNPVPNYTYTEISLPAAANSQVAFALAAGRDQNNLPYLLAMVNQRGSSTGAGIWRLSGGNTLSPSSTWTHVNSTISTTDGDNPAGNRQQILIDPNNPNVVYAYDQAAGIWRNNNYGVGSWTNIYPGAINTDANSGYIALNPAIANELWVSWQGAGTSGGVFKLSNANTGTPTPTPITTLSTVTGGICIAPNGDVYVLVLGNSPSQPNTQLWASIDGGATWSRADDGSLAMVASLPIGMVYASNGRIYIGNDSNNLAFGYPLQPSGTAAVSLNASASMIATAIDVQGPTKNAAAFLRATASMSGSTSSTKVGTVALQATATLASGSAVFIVQQVNGSSTFDYGASSVEISTTQGNTLVVLAGWDLSTEPTDAPMPAVTVTDSAGNYWIHVATTTSNVTGSRSSAWICPNAFAVEWVSVSLSTFACSLAYTVLELNGQTNTSQTVSVTTMPLYYSLDISDAESNVSSSSLSMTPGLTTDVDFAFAVFSAAAFVNPPTGVSQWNTLTSVTAGTSLTDFNPISIFPYYIAPTANNTSLNTTFTITRPVPVSAIIFAVHSTVTAPQQYNPNFPALKIEMGFGYTPGDPTQAPPLWTDITARCIGSAGQAFISAAMGRQYELAVAEAGEITIGINNSDGAFTPGNPNSPYFPNVVLETPVRVSAFWNGSWYFVAYGYVERWPQEWPDLPQFGISRMVATDAIAVLASASLIAPLDMELVLDAPYVCLPGSEQYTVFVNGINPTFLPADAQGQFAQNISKYNQRAGMYVDGTAGVAAQTGLSTGLLGSGNTAFGTGAYTPPLVGPASGPGIIYTDPNLPNPVNGPVTITFWVVINTNAQVANLQPTVFTAYGTPSNYQSSTPAVSIQIMNLLGNNTLQLTLFGGVTFTAPFSISNSPQQITVIISTFSISIYVNGGLATVGISPGNIIGWSAFSLGCPNYAFQTGANVVGNFTLFDFALYPYALTTQRIVSQFATGVSGQQNVDALQRMAQILAWAQLGIPRGGRETFNGLNQDVLEGPAYTLQGNNAADGLNQVALNESGMYAAMPSGSLVYIHRWALFNQAPVVIFGDSVSVGDGEVPALQASSWSYDNTYLFNNVQVTLQYGANNLFTVTTVDFNSQHQYFTRSALTETISTMNNLDAVDMANWQLNKYSQPNLRVSNVTIDAASNPNVAFPAVLGIQQGQAAIMNRRPLGGAEISQNVIIQKISHSIGPGVWQTSVQLSPYVPEGNMLQFDVTGENDLGTGTLG